MIANTDSGVIPATDAAPVKITVAAVVTIDATAPLALRRAISQALTVPNPAWLDAEANGRSTRDLDPYLFYAHRANDGALVVPRGAQPRVRALCREHGVAVEMVDATHLAAPVAFEERVTLSVAQERAVGEVLGRRIGVLEAPAGAGKTVMGLVAVARRGQPTLWVTHTKELARQAVERAGLVLGLTPDEIGFIGDGQCTVGTRLTVALVQSLARSLPEALLDVGHLIVDEAHHTPAEQLAAVVAQIPARYVLGLTATPYRRDKLDAVIGWYLGPTVARIDKADLQDRLITPRVVKRDTGLRLFGDTFTGLVSDLVADPARNRLIVADVAQAVATGRRCLVLSDRVGHVEQLAEMLTTSGVTAAALHGQMGKRKRAEVVAALAAGTLQVVVATVSLISEGFDEPSLDALFLATPMSYGGRVTQALGRVSRTAPGKRDALVTDYCDNHPMLWASYLNRRAVYVGQGCPIENAPAMSSAPCAALSQRMVS